MDLHALQCKIAEEKKNMRRVRQQLKTSHKQLQQARNNVSEIQMEFRRIRYIVATLERDNETLFDALRRFD